MIHPIHSCAFPAGQSGDFSRGSARVDGVNRSKELIQCLRNGLVIATDRQKDWSKQ